MLVGSCSLSVAMFSERDFPQSGSLFEGRDSGGECGVVSQRRETRAKAAAAAAARWQRPRAMEGCCPLPHSRFASVSLYFSVLSSSLSLSLQPYNYRFTMPHEHASNRDETWWSVSYGPVRWIVISTEHAFNAGSPQYAFVEAQLKSVNRKQTPFVFLAGHRPMYAYAMMNSVAGMLRNAFEPLMLKHKVDAAFWGHQHAYAHHSHTHACTRGCTHSCALLHMCTAAHVVDETDVCASLSTLHPSFCLVVTSARVRSTVSSVHLSLTAAARFTS